MRMRCRKPSQFLSMTNRRPKSWSSPLMPNLSLPPLPFSSFPQPFATLGSRVDRINRQMSVRPTPTRLKRAIKSEQTDWHNCRQHTPTHVEGSQQAGGPCSHPSSSSSPSGERATFYGRRARVPLPQTCPRKESHPGISDSILQRGIADV